MPCHSHSVLLLLCLAAWSDWKAVLPPTAVAFVPIASTVRMRTTTQRYSAPPKPKPDQQQQQDKLEKALLDILETEQRAEANERTDAAVDPSSSMPEESWDDFVHRHVATDCSTYTAKESLLAQDDALRWVSSEMGIKQYTNQSIDDAAIATAVLLERTLDTMEDVALHIRRHPGCKVPRQEATNNKAPDDDDEALQGRSSTPTKRKKVVVLGSGWGAHALLKVADCEKVQVTVVSPTNHFVFTPMLASAAVGTVEYRSMTESVRDANPTIQDYVQGKAVDVNVHDRQVTVQLNSLLAELDDHDTVQPPPPPPQVTLDYDHLIVAVGNQVSDGNVPGARQYCLRLKTCDDARRLRTAVGEAFEYASRPGIDDAERARRVTFVVVGGGPTGVELAGELSDFCHDITMREGKAAYPKLAHLAKVVLVHGGDALLPQFEEDLREEAVRALEKRGVQVILNTRVSKVEKDAVTLSTKQFDAQGQPTGERTERRLPMGLSVWCAGIAPVPFVDTLLSKLPEQARGQGGRVHVDRWLRPPMPSPDLMGSVFVLGDAASLPVRRRNNDKNEILPQTAQVAGQEGAYVARLLTRGYNLTAPVPTLPCYQASEQGEDVPCQDPSLAAWLKFRNLETAPGFAFLNLGLLAYLGGGKALSQVQIGDVPVFSYAGSVAFVLWRSVYLVKQVATRNRVLVTFDWIKSALFGRDTTRL